MVKITSAAEVPRRSGNGLVPRAIRVPDTPSIEGALGRLAATGFETAVKLNEAESKSYVAGVRAGLESESVVEFDRRKVEDDANGFSDRFLGWYDERVKKRLKEAPTNDAREAAQAAADIYRERIQARGDLWEHNQRALAVLRDTEQQLADLGMLAYRDPERWKQQLGAGRAIISSMRASDALTPDKEAELLERFKSAVTVAGIRGFIDRDAQATLARLEAGEFDNDLGDVDRVRALTAEAQKAVDADRRSLSGEVRALSKDHLASIQTTGEGIPGFREKAQAIMDPDDFRRFEAAEKNARDFHTFSTEAAFATPDDMVRTLESLKPEPGTEGFAERQRTYETALSAAQNIMKQRADDPAGYAMARPDIARAFQRASEEGDLSVETALTMRLNAQADMGIAPRNRRVLDKLQAKTLVGEFEAAPAADRAQRMAALQDQYGEHFVQAFGELVREGLSPETQVLGSVLGDLQAMKDLAEAIEVGRTELRKGLDTTELKDLRREVDKIMQPFAQRVFKGAITATRMGQVNALTQAAENLALLYMRNGEGRADSVMRAFNSLVGSRYDLDTIPTAYIPFDIDGERIDPAKVGAMADAKKTRERIVEFDPVPMGDPGRLDEPAHRESTINTAVNSGFWVTNESGTGLVLMVPFRGGGALPLLNADGARLEVGFADATRSGIVPVNKNTPGGGIERQRGEGARQEAERRQREIEEMRSRIGK